LASLGVPEDVWRYSRWDADLIPDAPFTDFVKMITRGYNLRDLLGPFLPVPGLTVPVPDIAVPPRAPALSSTTTSHAFVGIGATDTEIWLHDSGSTFAGGPSLTIRKTWEEFRSKTIDETQTKELRTLIFFKPPKPARLRRGSIVLEGGIGASLQYGSGTTTLSTWKWDGKPYERGYFWDDPAETLPDDDTFGNRFVVGLDGKLPGEIRYSVGVANVTGVSRGYRLRVELSDTSGTILAVGEHEVSLAAYEWRKGAAEGTLSGSVIDHSGVFTIGIQLIDFEDEEFQDVKVIDFRVGTLPIG